MNYSKTIYQILKSIDNAFENQNFKFEETFNLEKLKISEHRLYLLLENLINDGYIQGFIKIPIMGQVQNQLKAMNPSLTTAGITYLEDNATMKKAYETLKEIKGWIPGYN